MQTIILGIFDVNRVLSLTRVEKKQTQPSTHCRDTGKISIPAKRTLQKPNPLLLCPNATDFALSFVVRRKKKSGLVKSVRALL